MPCPGVPWRRLRRSAFLSIGQLLRKKRGWRTTGGERLTTPPASEDTFGQKRAIPASTPKMRTMRNRMRKSPNRTLATACAPTAMPVKPKIPATTEIRKKMIAQVSIEIPVHDCTKSPRARSSPASVLRSAVPRGKLATAPEKPQNQRYDKQHQKNEEQHLRDFRGAGGDSAKAEQSSDKRYDKEHHGVMQHD